MFRVRGSVGDAYAEMAARHGVLVAPRNIEPRFRAAFRQMPPLAFPDTPPEQIERREYEWWKGLVGTVFSGEQFADFDAFFRDLFDYFAEARAWTLFPDVPPTLTALRARDVRMALVSNLDGRLVPICQGLGLAGTFDTIVMSARVGFAKPDPRIFECAVQRLGVERAATVHVGDSEREDLDGARAAGLRALLIRRETAVPDAHTVSDLRQLVERVDTW